MKLASPSAPSRVRTWSLLLLVSLTLALFSFGYRMLAEQRSSHALVEVVLHGRVGLADAETVAALNADLVRLARARQERTRAALEAWSRERLEALFAPSEQAVAAYLDWYYSLPGSYMRLGHAVMGDLDGLLQRRMHDHLLVDSGIQAGLAGFEEALLAESARRLAGDAEAIGQALHGLYAQRLTSPSTADATTPVARIDLDRMLPSIFAASDDDLQRWQGSAQASVIGGGAVGLLALRPVTVRLMARPAVQQATRPLAGYVARLSPRLAAALAAGGTAGAATAPSGPAALLAGTATAATMAGIFIASDWALLKLEEHAQRGELERELLAGLAQARDEAHLASSGWLAALLGEAERQRAMGLERAYDEAAVPARFHVLRRRAPAD